MAYVQPTNPPYIIGSFQYLWLYICPAPGKTSASHMALFASGCHVLQSLFFLMGCSDWFSFARLLLSVAVKAESTDVLTESAEAMAGTFTSFFSLVFWASTEVEHVTRNAVMQIFNNFNFTVSYNFNWSKTFMMCSSSSSLAKGMLILPFPLAEQVNCTLVLRD